MPRRSDPPPRPSAASTRTSCSGASSTSWRSSGPSPATRSGSTPWMSGPMGSGHRRSRSMAGSPATRVSPSAGTSCPTTRPTARRCGSSPSRPRSSWSSRRRTCSTPRPICGSPSSAGGGRRDTRFRSVAEAFEEELLAFHALVVDGTAPKAGIVEGRADIVTSQRIIARRAAADRPAGRDRGAGLTERTIVHLVPHTHWDREWYEPFQIFRMRLVALVDQLLERMERDPRLRFTLDGQAATVDDYLEVRPDAEPLIRRLIAEGRLAIGPWQILLDEFLVSGETIIRNLEFGWARAEALGRAMPVGYLPDMFGHIAQMPQILQRAGIERAVVWRGVPEVDRLQHLPLVRAGRLGGRDRVPGRWLWQRRLPVRRPGPPRLEAGRLPDRQRRRSTASARCSPCTAPTTRSPPLAWPTSSTPSTPRDDGIEVRLETLADYAARPEPDDRPFPTLDRGAALGRPGQHADGRQLRADRPARPPRVAWNASSSATPSH